MNTTTRIASVAAWSALTIGVLTASHGGAQVLLLDDFDDTHGPLAAQGDGLVDVSTYRAPFGGDANDAFVGRTQFRFDLPAENVATVAPGSTDGKVAVLELSTFNPLDAGAAFYGSDMITKRNFARGGGLRMTTRMRVDAPTAAQGGMVAAPFLYDTQREKPPGTLVRDEIDHELITNLSTGATPHNTFTNVWNDGDFASAGSGALINNPAGFNITAFHDYRTDWTPTAVRYYIDDQLVRTESSVVPDDPMRAHWNFWAPDNTFMQAYNPAFNPTSTGPGATYRMELDQVKVERLDTAKGPNLLVDPSFETQIDVAGGIGGWNRFNNAFYEGIEVEPQEGSTTLKVYGPFRGPGMVDASGAFQNVAAAPGEEFEASVWAYADSVDHIKGNENYTALTLQFANASNQVIGSVMFSPGTNQKETPIYDGRDTNMIEDEWVQYAVNGVAPAGTAYARINLFFIQLNNQGGAVWFDNAELARLTSTAPVADADFDNDNDVDGADFLTWQRGFGGAGGNANGDANGDNTVDGQDFSLWKNQFGQSSSTASASAVPEPSAWLAALVLSSGGAAIRRRLA